MTALKSLIPVIALCVFILCGGTAKAAEGERYIAAAEIKPPSSKPRSEPARAKSDNAGSTDFVWGQVSGANVNVRSGPGTQAGILTTLHGGDYVRAKPNEGRWLEIEWPRNAPAYINRDAVKVTRGGGMVAVIKAEQASVFANASAQAQPAFKLSKGTEVTILGEDGRRLKIKAPQGAKAFISAKYVVVGVEPPVSKLKSTKAGEKLVSSVPSAEHPAESAAIAREVAPEPKKAVAAPILEIAEPASKSSAPPAVSDAAEQARKVSEARLREVETARLAAEAKKKAEEEEQAKKAADARKQEEESARLAVEAKKQAEAAEQARIAKEEKQHLEEAARLVEETRKQAEAEAQARKIAEAKERQQQEEAARLVAEAQKQAAAGEQARLIAEAQQREEAARLAAEEKKRVAIVEQVRRLAAAKQQEEEAARLIAEKKKAEAEEQSRKIAEAARISTLPAPSESYGEFFDPNTPEKAIEKKIEPPVQPAEPAAEFRLPEPSDNASPAVPAAPAPEVRPAAPLPILIDDSEPASESENVLPETTKRVSSKFVVPQRVPTLPEHRAEVIAVPDSELPTPSGSAPAAQRLEDFHGTQVYRANPGAAPINAEGVLERRSRGPIDGAGYALVRGGITLYYLTARQGIDLESLTGHRIGVTGVPLSGNGLSDNVLEVSSAILRD